MTSAADVRAAREAADLIGEHLRATIRGAVADGVPVAEIAEAAKLSKARIYQIRDENRRTPHLP
jgi:AcrR family transcriptional regulator